MFTQKTGIVSLVSALACVPCLAGQANDLRLIEAVKRQDRQIVGALLMQRVDVNAREGDGATALHWAAYWNDIPTADRLIRTGADVDASNDYGVTPLWLACASGHASMVGALLAGGANANAALSNGETVLMRCAYTGLSEGVKALLDKGAEVNAAEPSHGQTALMWATVQQHSRVVQVLLEHGADLHARTRTAPRLVGIGPSVSSGFISDGPGGGPSGKSGMEVQTGGFTALLFAAQQGDLDSARMLLAAGADRNDVAADGTSVLVVAAHSGHGNLAAFFLSQGADPNAAGAGYTAMHAAILRGDLDLVSSLLAHGADPNERIVKGTAVARWGYNWILPAQLLGATPFFLAAKYGEVAIMRLLASSGADTAQGLNDGTTPLMAAAGVGWHDTLDRRGRALSVEVLAAEREQEGRTLDAVKLALASGGKVVDANLAGETALHGAAAKGFKTVVKLLVDQGGDLNIRNKSGRTPADLLGSRPAQR